MRLLLDTHAFLWAIADDPRLGERSQELITRETSAVWLSHASLWEIAIKHALARGDMSLSAAQASQWAAEASLALLPADRLAAPAHAGTSAASPPRSLQSPAGGPGEWRPHW